MNGVKFDIYHSFRNLRIVLSSKSIGAPSVKTQTIDIPGADGSLDFTEYFGETKYNNRTLKFNFTMIGNGEYQLTQYSYIKNLLHGQRMKIILDADSDFYYIGRLTVSDLNTNKNINTFSVSCDCEPYKYKVNKTIIVNTLTGNQQTLIFTNSRKSVVPKITVSAATEIIFNNVIYSLSAGTYTDDNIIFKVGNNVMTVTGSGTMTVEYQEGSL